MHVVLLQFSNLIFINKHLHPFVLLLQMASLSNAAKKWIANSRKQYVLPQTAIPVIMYSPVKSHRLPTFIHTRSLNIAIAALNPDPHMPLINQMIDTVNPHHAQLFYIPSKHSYGDTTPAPWPLPVLPNPNPQSRYVPPVAAAAAYIITPPVPRPAPLNVTEAIDNTYHGKLAQMMCNELGRRIVRGEDKFHVNRAEDTTANYDGFQDYKDALMQEALAIHNLVLADHDSFVDWWYDSLLAGFPNGDGRSAMEWMCLLVSNTWLEMRTKNIMASNMEINHHNNNYIIPTSYVSHAMDSEDVKQLYYEVYPPPNSYITTNPPQVGVIPATQPPSARGNRRLKMLRRMMSREQGPKCFHPGRVPPNAAAPPTFNNLCKMPCKGFQPDNVITLTEPINVGRPFAYNHNNTNVHETFSLPVVVIEVLGNKDTWGKQETVSKLLSELCYMLCFSPIAYGIMVDEDGIWVYKAVRNPARGKLDVTKEYMQFYPSADPPGVNVMNSKPPCIIQPNGTPVLAPFGNRLGYNVYKFYKRLLECVLDVQRYEPVMTDCIRDHYNTAHYTNPHRVGSFRPHTTYFQDVQKLWAGGQGLAAPNMCTNLPLGTAALGAQSCFHIRSMQEFDQMCLQEQARDNAAAGIHGPFNISEYIKPYN